MDFIRAGCTRSLFPVHVTRSLMSVPRMFGKKEEVFVELRVHGEESKADDGRVRSILMEPDVPNVETSFLTNTKL